MLIVSIPNRNDSAVDNVESQVKSQTQIDHSKSVDLEAWGAISYKGDYGGIGIPPLSEKRFQREQS